MFEEAGAELKDRLRRWTRSLAGEEGWSRLAALPRPKSEFGVDPFGLDLDWALSAAAPLIWLYRHYFRVEVHDIAQVPAGRVLLVGNHGGQLPLDGAMIAVSMLLEADPPRIVRSMVEKWVPSLPYVSTFMSRAGQIVGTPENCRRLLQSGESILIFPEGIRGMSKLWSQRYQLQDFGLGFMRLALETDTPIVPVAVIGSEEQAPAFANLRPLAKLIGFPAFPLTPWGLPLPLPTKYRLHFGKPMRFSGNADDEDGELDKKVGEVKSALAALIAQGLEARSHVFW
ncbi:MAG: lysophospholipid acyltransferase family protein [Myxococcaceae bacterium]